MALHPGRAEPTSDNSMFRGPHRAELEEVETLRFSKPAKVNGGKGIEVHPPAILALDPGGTLGWSLLVLNKRLKLNMDIDALLDNRIAWWHGQVDMKTCEDTGLQIVRQAIDRCPGALVVSEGFTLRTKVLGKDPLSPVRQSAVVKHFCWLRGRRYYEQDPSFKTTASDARLRNWRVYTREGGLQHARDADRHALVFLRRLISDARLLMSINGRNGSK